MQTRAPPVPFRVLTFNNRVSNTLCFGAVSVKQGIPVLGAAGTATGGAHLGMQFGGNHQMNLMQQMAAAAAAAATAAATATAAAAAAAAAAAVATSTTAAETPPPGARIIASSVAAPSVAMTAYVAPATAGAAFGGRDEAGGWELHRLMGEAAASAAASSNSMEWEVAGPIAEGQGGELASKGAVVGPFSSGVKSNLKPATSCPSLAELRGAGGLDERRSRRCVGAVGGGGGEGGG